jgi:hypothetical protein
MDAISGFVLLMNLIIEVALSDCFVTEYTRLRQRLLKISMDGDPWKLVSGERENVMNMWDYPVAYVIRFK